MKPCSRDHYPLAPACFACWRASLSASAPSMEELTRSHPADFAAFAESDFRWVSNVLLADCAQTSLVGWPRGRPPLVVSWASQATPAIAKILPVPAAVAVGLSRARGEREGARSPHDATTTRLLERLDSHVDPHMASLWRDLALLAEERDPVAASGLRASVERRARPARWARSLEWLLLLGRQLNGLDAELTIALAEQHRVVRQAISRCYRSETLTVQLRAAGLRTAAADRTRPLEERLLDIVAGSVDSRRTRFPRPLAAPSSTWLADDGLEDLVRGAAQRAAAEFASSIDDQGPVEEEHLTATLLTEIVHEFKSLPASTRLAGGEGPQVSVGHRTVTKKEEKTNGADIGVVVNIHVPGRLRSRTGDLIQVKKSSALARERTGREDTWTIKRRQLHNLLDSSASAVYWLIRGNGGLLVVPAKYLAAVEEATARPSTQQFTVGYTAVRHTAVPLEQYLTDLTVGLWLGSSSATTLAAAQGTGRTTRPRFALTVDVLLESGDDGDFALLPGARLG